MFSRNGKNHNDARYCIHIRAGRELQFSDNAGDGKGVRAFYGKKGSKTGESAECGHGGTKGAFCGNREDGAANASRRFEEKQKATMENSYGSL